MRYPARPLLPLLLLSWLVACGPKSPPASAGSGSVGKPMCDPQGWPEAARAPMRAAQARGLTLAARDRFGWEATDRATELLGGAAALRALQTTSYVIDQRAPTDAVVRFIRQDDTSTEALLTVRFDAEHPHGLAEQAATPEALDPEGDDARMIRALRTSLADARFERKAPSYNPDVVPWSADPSEGWAAYLIPGAASFSAVPLGGGYRVHLSPDGRSISEFLPLTQSVLSVDVDAMKREASAVFATTVLTPYPDATYIAFANIWEIPLAVVTPENGAWLISGDTLCWMDVSK